MWCVLILCRTNAATTPQCNRPGGGFFVVPPASARFSVGTIAFAGESPRSARSQWRRGDDARRRRSGERFAANAITARRPRRRPRRVTRASRAGHGHESFAAQPTAELPFRRKIWRRRGRRRQSGRRACAFGRRLTSLGSARLAGHALPSRQPDRAPARSKAGAKRSPPCVPQPPASPGPPFVARLRRR
jgi:hypothetical protein